MTTSVAAHSLPAAQGIRRRRRWVVPAIFLVVLLAVLGRGMFTQEAPSTMLGASGYVPGGLARLNGVLPYAQAGPRQGEVPPEGFHGGLSIYDVSNPARPTFFLM